MGIEFSEGILLVTGGILISSLFSLIHFISTYNRINRSLAALSSIIIGAAAICIATIFSGHDPLTSLEESMTSAIVGLLNLLPVVFSVATIALFRITLLTNRSVDATS
jgi:hypothetical protein